MITNFDYRMLGIADSSFVKFVEKELALEAKLASLTAMDIVGEEQEQSRLLNMYNNVAVISIKGMLVNEDSWYNRYFGCVSYNEIREAIIQSTEQGAEAIVFDIDSPGGNVNGMDDTANLISNVGVKTISFTSGSMSSAAYFLGSQADYTYAGDFAEVGSVGVIVKLYDRSKMLKDVGITAMRFRSGELKASGDPDFTLTAKEKAYIQDKVDNYASKFYQIVSDARGMPLATLETYGITSGRTFIGREALEVNLVDGIRTFDETMLKAFNLAKEVDKGVNNGLSLH